MILGNGLSYLEAHSLSDLVKGSSVPVGGVIVYNSGMDGISIPPGQEQGLTIIASIVNNNENKVVWDAQFLTSKFSGLELVSFVPNNVTVGAPVGLGTLATGGDPPYNYHRLRTFCTNVSSLRLPP